MSTFGQRKSGAFHGTITLPGPKRVFCSVTSRTYNAIYLELRETASIPFRFRVEFETRASPVDCEVKIQRGTSVIAFIVGEAAIASPRAAASHQPVTLEDFNEWAGMGAVARP
ncbi:MAG: hypothetical protein NW216_13645 [Hyphomicrobium sp.]|nr:hypothetical protein [Hyphomicrobium sp.]